MGDTCTDFNMPNGQVSGGLQRQLAAVLMPALPTQMGEGSVSASQTGRLYGVTLLRVVCAHHYGPGAIKARLLTAA